MGAASYTLVPIPNKGLGLVATKDIVYGELIFEEKPVLDTSFDEGLDEQFHKLSENEQNQVMDLANEFPEDEKLQGIMKTNCHYKDTKDAILCLLASRLNHSCMPNVLTTFNGVYERAIAKRNISKGEELCSSYSDLNIALSRVKEDLKLEYRFNCKCELCTLKDEEERKVIETNRLKYGELDTKLDRTYAESSNHQERLKQVKELFETMRLGKLSCPGLIARNAYDGFQASLLCRNHSEAVKYIKQAYEANLITEGEDNSITKEFLSLMINPEQHILFNGWSHE